MRKGKRTRQRSAPLGGKASAKPSVSRRPTTPTNPSPQPQLRINWREHSIHASIVLIALFALYAMTMPRVVTFEDSGIFNLACHQGGVAHPPGYPLYSLLCYPFAHLPFITTAFGLNLMSALLGALSCVVLYLIAVLLLRRPVYAYIAAFSYGLCAIFWSQAIIQEVYTLHTLLLFTLFFLALLYRRTPTARILYGFALLYGLSLANHWPLMGMATPALAILLLAGLRFPNLRTLANCAGLFALGLTPYLYLLASANGDSLANFLGPIETVRQFTEFVGRVGFSNMDDQGGAWSDKALFFKLMLADSVTQYGILALPLIAVGFVSQWRRWGWVISSALSWMYLTVYVLILVLGFDFYKPLAQETFVVYAVPAYIAFALWLAAGIATVYAWLLETRWARSLAEAFATRYADSKWAARFRQMLPPILLAAVAAGVLLNQAVGNFSTARNDDRVASIYATTVLQGLADNANLLINTSHSLPFLSAGPVDRIRPDVQVFHSNGIFLNNRYVSARTSPAQKEIATRAFIKASRVPLYYLSKQPHDYGVEDFGIYKKVRKDLPAGQVVFHYPPGGVKLLETVNAIADNAPAWNFHFKRYALGEIARVVLAIGMDAAQSRPYLELLEKDFYGKIALAAKISLTPDQQQAKIGLRYLQQAEKQLTANTPPREQSRIYLYRGLFLNWTHAPLDEVEANLLRSIEIYPAPNNIARKKLARLNAARKG